MKHCKTLSRVPEKAADLSQVPVESWVTFVTAVLSAVAVLLAAKESAESGS